jgi:hypothetical protein
MHFGIIAPREEVQKAKKGLGKRNIGIEDGKRRTSETTADNERGGSSVRCRSIQ